MSYVDGINSYMFQTRTFRRKDQEWEDEVHHALLGLASESGEVLDVIIKGWHSPRPDIEPGIDYSKLIKELGDVMFFWCWVADVFHLDPIEIMQENIDKLSARYGKEA